MKPSIHKRIEDKAFKCRISVVLSTCLTKNMVLLNVYKEETESVGYNKPFSKSYFHDCWFSISISSVKSISTAFSVRFITNL